MDWTFNNVPLEQVGTLWHLSGTIRNQWQRLEVALRLISDFLIEESGVYLPVDFDVFRLPSRYGCDRAVHDPRYARKLAMRCRDAFMPLVSLCSFAISLHLTDEEIHDVDNPAWAKLLIEKRGLHPEWVHSLRQSVVADFSPNTRVGVIVDVAKCQWLSQVCAMLRARVPIWFYWGNWQSMARVDHPVATLYRTTSEQMLALPNYSKEHLEELSRPGSSCNNDPEIPEPEPSS